ncbi:putative transcriptional regulator [Caulobacter ginsengisoli]|uniref:Transcriptional regulator n=1 Tax=Caulobacter ginsengisoli TaxID=400775 RepID=A0ABU0IKG6_9CAUL|nr:BlaI/MecI/CopY family transcriptional regulator [Caulobacter ginsengisoli]MDQ0462505.1 putative transcriptional regulator [Caulobacter ginsengisoli]
MPPSDTELALLKLFWQSGPMSAREVQDALPAELDWAASTTRTVLERMRAKGLISRRSVHGMAVYAPAQDKVSVLGAALKRMMRGVLEIDAALPAAAFSGSKLLSEDELKALETLLNAQDVPGEGQ